MTAQSDLMRNNQRKYKCSEYLNYLIFVVKTAHQEIVKRIVTI